MFVIEHCSVAECASGNTEIPNFDMSVKTRAGKRVWINMSTIVFDNQRTGRRLLIHLAHDITEEKKGEKLMHKMLELSKQLSSLGEGPVHPEPVSPLVGTGEKHSPHVLRRAKKARRSRTFSASAPKPFATTSITSTRNCAPIIVWKQS